MNYYLSHLPHQSLAILFDCLLPVQQCLKWCHCHPTSHLRIWEDCLLLWHLSWLSSACLVHFLLTVTQAWSSSLVMVVWLVFSTLGCWKETVTMSVTFAMPAWRVLKHIKAHFPHANFWHETFWMPSPYLELRDFESFHTTLFSIFKIFFKSSTLSSPHTQIL